ncbi:hypothetical protein ACIGDI_29635 [Streptomyces sp. NPDC085900]|uniref:hypothetical protein n=1 Tax=Streptomyces sp. NPDC085900 TaxID=3365737 RepID=UPI0037D5293E
MTGDNCPAAYLLSDNSVAVMGTVLSEEARKKHHIPEPRPHHAIVIVPGELIRDAKKGLPEA